MANKKATAKELQEYEPKPVFPTCSNCIHFKSDMVKNSAYFGDYTQEKNIRCGIGGFAVKKLGTCKLHQFAVHPAN